jgi:hypothetical protein
MGRKQLVTREAAVSLVRQLIENGDIPQFVTMLGQRAWHFGRHNEYNRKLFQDYLIKEQERTGALMVHVEICNECGHSVAPGSGRFVNRVSDFNLPERRKEIGRPYPQGEFLCAECYARGGEVRP